MKTTKLAAALVACTFAAGAAETAESGDFAEQMAKAAPRNMKLMIAGFGTIESMTNVDKWLGEQLQPSQNLETFPSLSEADKISNPDLAREVVRLNWLTRKMEYVRLTNELAEENARNKRLLSDLRTKVLATDSTRYVPLAKEYLQAAISRRAGTLIQVVDRSNVDMAAVEQAFNGENSSSFAGAGCILTAALGDREEDTKIVPVNARTSVKVTVYTQPFVFKIRDLQGNVLVADNGTATWKETANSVVRSSASDPARKLMEDVCAQIAEKTTEFFTAKMAFRVKAPGGMDADDAEVAIDGRKVSDIDGKVQVLAVEHVVTAELDGCKPIRKVVSVDNDSDTVSVKLKFTSVDKPSVSDEV